MQANFCLWIFIFMKYVICFITKIKVVNKNANLSCFMLISINNLDKMQKFFTSLVSSIGRTIKHACFLSAWFIQISKWNIHIDLNSFRFLYMLLSIYTNIYIHGILDQLKNIIFHDAIDKCLLHLLHVRKIIIWHNGSLIGCSRFDI